VSSDMRRINRHNLPSGEVNFEAYKAISLDNCDAHHSCIGAVTHSPHYLKHLPLARTGKRHPAAMVPKALHQCDNQSQSLRQGHSHMVNSAAKV
jgi:hypothetical protein